MGRDRLGPAGCVRISPSLGIEPSGACALHERHRWQSLEDPSFGRSRSPAPSRTSCRAVRGRISRRPRSFPPARPQLSAAAGASFRRESAKSSRNSPHRSALTRCNQRRPRLRGLATANGSHAAALTITRPRCATRSRPAAPATDHRIRARGERRKPRRLRATSAVSAPTLSSAGTAPRNFRSPRSLRWTPRDPTSRRRSGRSGRGGRDRRCVGSHPRGAESDSDSCA